MVIPFGQGLVNSKGLREAFGLPLFCPSCPAEGETVLSGVSRKREIILLCDPCASSPAYNVTVRKGDIEEAFSRFDLIVDRTYKAVSQDHEYFEPEAAVAIPFGRRELTFFGANHNPLSIRHTIARALGWQDTRHYSNDTVR